MARLPGDFARLLRELRGAGPLDRIRLLGRSLAALRRLSPWDRKVLLRMAGFEGAEMLVERLAGEDQETAQALEGMLSELEKHPGELQRTVRSLNDPRHRGEAIDELLARLEFAAPAAVPEEVEADEGEAPAAALPATAEPWADPVAAEGPPQGPPFPEVAPPSPGPGEAEPAATEAALPETLPRPQTVAPPPIEAPPEEPQAIASAEPPPAPAAEPPAPAPDESHAASPPAEEARPGPVEPAEPFRLARAPSAVGALGCLLDLRRDLDAGRQPSPAELHRLLDEELPFPWARRRALQAWLSADVTYDVEDALALVDVLPAGPDRAWALATLAAARPWEAAAWDRIVAAASGPAGRRHLELRRGRA